MGLFRRLRLIIREFLSYVDSPRVEEKTPEVLLEAAKQDFRDKMVECNRAFARLGSIGERLRNQMDAKRRRAIELEKRILANYKAANTELAGSLARELQEVELDRERDGEELEDAEAAYESNRDHVRILQHEFEQNVKRLERRISRVKLEETREEAAAALREITENAGNTGEAWKNVEDLLDTKQVVARAKAQVARDLGDEAELEEQEVENKAKEQRALSEFLERRRMSAEAASSTQEAE